MGPSCRYCSTNTGAINQEKYRIVVMETNGRVTIGRAYDTFEEVHNAMIELRMIYAKNEVAHHVGYVKE